MIEELKNRRSENEKQKFTFGQHVRLLWKRNSHFTKVINLEKWHL